MSFEQRTPCSSCPYRKDVPPGTWDRSEFENLLEQDADPFNGNVFGCHEGRKKPPEERQLCIGWVLDQRRRNVPSIKLRLMIATRAGCAEAVNKAHDGGYELYDSIEEMARINIPLTRRKGRKKRANGKDGDRDR